jgi:hypothetical protein
MKKGDSTTTVLIPGRSHQSSKPTKYGKIVTKGWMEANAENAERLVRAAG